MRTRRAASLALVLSLFVATLAGADEILLFDGQRLTGKIQGDHLEIVTSSGSIRVPFASLSRLVTEDAGNVELDLVDGSSLHGHLTASGIALNQGLYDRTLPLSGISSVRWDPPSVVVPEGTKVSLELIRALSSRDAEAGRPVAYCVSDPVVVDGKTIVAKHAAAWGDILGAGGGRNAEGGGKLAVRATGVLAVDGTEIPLRGTMEATGGVNGGAIVASGVLGLLEEGNAAEATPGSRLEAVTTKEAHVGLLPRPASAQHAAMQRECDDYYSLLTADFIPAERLGGGKVFAPVPQPLRISVPIARFVQSREELAHGVGLGAIVMDAISIPALNIDIDPRRKGGANLTLVANIYVRPSFDRWVSLEYQLVAGDRVVATAKEPRIDAEEGKVKVVKTKFQLTAEQLAALASNPDPRLRILMTAIAN